MHIFFADFEGLVVGTALLQSIRRDEFSFRERGFCHGFSCEFFCGFLGAFLPFKRRTENPQRYPQQNSRQNPCKIHACSEKRCRKIHSAGRGGRFLGCLLKASRQVEGMWHFASKPPRKSLQNNHNGGTVTGGVWVWIRIRYVSKPVLIHIRFPFKYRERPLKRAQNIALRLMHVRERKLAVPPLSIIPRNSLLFLVCPNADNDQNIWNQKVPGFLPTGTYFVHVDPPRQPIAP